MLLDKLEYMASVVSAFSFFKARPSNFLWCLLTGSMAIVWVVKSYWSKKCKWGYKKKSKATSTVTMPSAASQTQSLPGCALSNSPTGSAQTTQGAGQLTSRHGKASSGHPAAALDSWQGHGHRRHRGKCSSVGHGRPGRFRRGLIRGTQSQHKGAVRRRRWRLSPTLWTRSGDGTEWPWRQSASSAATLPWQRRRGDSSASTAVARRRAGTWQCQHAGPQIGSLPDFRSELTYHAEFTSTCVGKALNLC